jgi:hypothetical protein
MGSAGRTVQSSNIVLGTEAGREEKSKDFSSALRFNAPIHFADRVAMIIAKGVNCWMEKETMRESYYMSNTLLHILGIK